MPNGVFKTQDPNTPGVLGVSEDGSDQAGPGVHGMSRAAGVVGESATWMGVYGKSDSTSGGHGVMGEALGTGVVGVGKTWLGVYGETQASPEAGAAAVWGDGKDGGDGVKGVANAPGKAAVCGFHLGTTGDGGPGVFGDSAKGRGVHGQGGVGVAGIGNLWIGVYGETNAAAEAGSAGVWGDGKGGGDGVKGVANAPGKAAVCGFHLGNSGPGVFGRGAPAGRFEGNVIVDGNVEVSGDLVLSGADYAEGLTAADPTVAPGTVVVVGESGHVYPCADDYDTTVAGIVSGAGGVSPAVVLDRHDGSVPVALVGKVWCLADADAAPIRPGDLLTTSSTPGHARRVTNLGRAFGAVIGKALTPLAAGRGEVRVLVSTR